jgi:hypothetical protein
MYGKYLPFYRADEYFEKEINLADVYFLVWYYINTTQSAGFLFPHHILISEIAENVMEVFEDEWEYAPENNFLKSHYVINESENDYYIARKLIDTVLFKTYLFSIDSYFDLVDSEKEIIEKHNDDSQQIVNYLNFNRDQKLHTTYTKLLGLKGNEWVAEILGSDHRLYDSYKKISKKLVGYFLYKGQDEKNLFIEHIASGKKLSLTKKSIDRPQLLSKIDTIMHMGIVQWQNEWWFSGVYFQIDYNPDLVLDEKNSIQSRSAVNFIDFQEHDVKGIILDQLKVFKQFNNDKQLAFINAKDANTFVNRFMEFYNSSLNLKQKDIDQAKKRARKDGFFVEKQDLSDEIDGEDVLMFFNPISGLEIVYDVNSAFPDKNNRFFDKGKSYDHVRKLIFSDEVSPELVQFWVDNYSDKLDLYKTDEIKFYKENLDFLMRFSKTNSYHTIPTVTLTGTNMRKK